MSVEMWEKMKRNVLPERPNRKKLRQKAALAAETERRHQRSFGRALDEEPRALYYSDEEGESCLTKAVFPAPTDGSKASPFITASEAGAAQRRKTNICGTSQTRTPTQQPNSPPPSSICQKKEGA